MIHPRRTNSINSQSGKVQLLLHVSILIHLHVVFLPLRPSVGLNYRVSFSVSSYAMKLVHLALCSFLLTLCAETSRWKRIAFRPTVFPLTKVILMDRKRRQSACLLQSVVSIVNEIRVITTETNWKWTSITPFTHMKEEQGVARGICEECNLCALMLYDSGV